MPAGSDNIIAVDYIEARSWGDPELLERLKGRAKRITLSDGGVEVKHSRVGRLQVFTAHSRFTDRRASVKTSSLLAVS